MIGTTPHRISDDGIGDLSNAGDRFPLLQKLDHFGESHGVGRLAVGSGGLMERSGFFVNVQICFGSGLLPGQGLWSRLLLLSLGQVLLWEHVGGQVVGVAGQPVLVLSEIDIDADLLSVVEDTSVGSHITIRALRGLSAGVPEDGIEPGLEAACASEKHGHERGQIWQAGSIELSHFECGIFGPWVHVKSLKDVIVVLEGTDAVGAGQGRRGLGGHGAVCLAD